VLFFWVVGQMLLGTVLAYRHAKEKRTFVVGREIGQAPERQKTQNT